MWKHSLFILNHLQCHFRSLICITLLTVPVCFESQRVLCVFYLSCIAVQNIVILRMFFIFSVLMQDYNLFLPCNKCFVPWNSLFLLSLCGFGTHYYSLPMPWRWLHCLNSYILQLIVIVILQSKYLWFGSMFFEWNMIFHCC